MTEGNISEKLEEKFQDRDRIEQSIDQVGRISMGDFILSLLSDVEPDRQGSKESNAHCLSIKTLPHQGNSLHLF